MSTDTVNELDWDQDTSPSLDLNNSNDTDILDVEEKEDTLFIEGMTQEIENHPHALPYLKECNRLRNQLREDLKDLSKDYDLETSVKVIFKIRKKGDLII